jgi:hypothetical protein
VFETANDLAARAMMESKGGTKPVLLVEDLEHVRLVNAAFHGEAKPITLRCGGSNVVLDAMSQTDKLSKIYINSIYAIIDRDFDPLFRSQRLQSDRILYSHYYDHTNDFLFDGNIQAFASLLAALDGGERCEEKLGVAKNCLDEVAQSKWASKLANFSGGFSVETAVNSHLIEPRAEVFHPDTCWFFGESVPTAHLISSKEVIRALVANTRVNCMNGKEAWAALNALITSNEAASWSRKRIKGKFKL